MTAQVNSPEAAGRAVEEILGRLTEAGDPAVVAGAEDLVRALMELYGGGLQRVVALLEKAGGLPPALLDDELLAGLLVLHGLHPEPPAARVRRALRSVDEVDAEVEEFDADTGRLRVRIEASGGGCGCGTTGPGARERIESALACHAPEVVAVEVVEPAPEPTLLQIGARPPGSV